MLSKDNQNDLIKSGIDQKQRFTLRKLSTGLASVLLGIAFLGYGTVAHADQPATTNNETSPTTQVTTIPTSATNTGAAVSVNEHQTGPVSNGPVNAGPAVQSEIATNFVYLSNPRDLSSAHVVHAPIVLHGKPGQPVDMSPANTVISQLLADHPDWYCANNGIASQTKYPEAGHGFESTITFAIVQQYKSQELLHNVDTGENSPVANQTTTAQYTYESSASTDNSIFQDWTDQTFASHDIVAPAYHHVQITGVHVTAGTLPDDQTNEPYENPDKQGKTVAQYANDLQQVLDRWLATNPNATFLPSYTIHAPLNVTFDVKYVADAKPVDASKVTVHFDFLSNANDSSNAQEVHAPLSFTGMPGQTFDNAPINNVINQILTAHPGWYVVLSGSKAMTVFPTNQDESYIYFANVPKYEAQEFVHDINNDSTTSVADHTTTAQYAYNYLTDNTGRHFTGWTPESFESHALTVPAGEHIQITGVHVQAASVPTDQANEPYIYDDNTGKSMDAYVKELQHELNQWVQNNPFSTTLPAFVIHAPMNITFDVKYVANTPVQPTSPQPTNPQPTNPQPTNPQPTNPQPTNPQPTNPQPTNPQPTNPQPTNPQPTNPQPTNPQPTTPTQPTQPTQPKGKQDEHQQPVPDQPNNQPQDHTIPSQIVPNNQPQQNGLPGRQPEQPQVLPQGQSKEVTHTQDQTLPQTGNEDHQTTSLAGLALVALLASFGLGDYKKRD